MSVDQAAPSIPGWATGLRRGVVVLLALGLLTMHGLTSSPASTSAAHHGHDAVVSMDAGQGTSTGAGHATSSTDGGHGALHAVGQACLWLIMGGALLFFLRRALTLLVQITRRDDGGRLEPSPGSLLRRPPDPRLATVALRC